MTDGLPGAWPTSLTPAMFARQPTVVSASLAPAGRRIAYAVEDDARTDLWVLSDSGWPVRITADQAVSGGSFTWTPDGQALLFTAAGDGKLWRTSSIGGRPSRVSRGEGRHHTPRISPDGRLVAYVADRGETVEIVVSAIDGSWQRLLNRGSDIPMTPAWSPDGRRVLWRAYPATCMPWDESAIVCGDVDGSSPRILASGSRTVFADARFSPDGSRVVCVSDRGGALNVTQLAVDGSEPRVLHADNWEHGEPVYAPDGRSIAYTRNVDGDYTVWVVPSGGGSPRPLVDEPGHATSLSWSPDGASIAYVFDSPVAPPDVWDVDVSSGRRAQRTHLSVGGVIDAGLVMPEHVTWTSPDGFEVHGHLYAPTTIQPGQHGCVVNIHGGPMNQSRVVWSPLIQYLVQRGWVVVASNYRGSLGYGRRYREALYGAWGEGDLADNLGAIGVVRERGWLNQERAVAWGGSAGGYSTLVCLTRAPEHFAGGVALFGLYDLYSFGLETHRYERYYVETILGPSSEQHELWRSRSPIHDVDRIRAPLLVLQGADDRVVLPRQSENLVRELERHHVDFEYVAYPGEGHGFHRIDNVVDYAQRMDRFLNEKVLHAPEPVTIDGSR